MVHVVVVRIEYQQKLLWPIKIVGDRLWLRGFYLELWQFWPRDHKFSKLRLLLDRGFDRSLMPLLLFVMLMINALVDWLTN
jgi:hypothetical protein